MDLKIPMSRSNWPPHQGTFARLNRQTISSLQRASWNFSSFHTFLSHVAAALNVAPLSEYTSEGLPRRQNKAFKTLYKLFSFKASQQFQMYSSCEAACENPQVRIPFDFLVRPVMYRAREVYTDHGIWCATCCPTTWKWTRRWLTPWSHLTSLASSTVAPNSFHEATQFWNPVTLSHSSHCKRNSTMQDCSMFTLN